MKLQSTYRIILWILAASLSSGALRATVCRADEPASTLPEKDSMSPDTLIPPAPLQEKQDRPWYTEIAEAQRRATETNRQVLLYVFADWCPWCVAMDDSVFGTSDVEAVRSDVVFARVNGDLDTLTVSKYRLQGYPTTYLLDKTGTEIDRVLGYRDPASFARWVKDALAGHGTLWVLEKEHREKRNDPKTMFALARKHLQRGQFSEADNFFQSVINNDQTNASGYADSAIFESAMLNRRNSEWYKAIEDLKTLLKKFPNSPLKEDAQLYIPWLLSRAGDREESIRMYKQFLDRFSNSSEANWVREQIQWLESRDDQS